MSRYNGRHRKLSQSVGSVKRAVSVTGVGIAAMTAVAGASGVAWACPTGSHEHARASVHSAVTNASPRTDRPSSSTHVVVTGSSPHTDVTNSRGASPSNPDGTSNGGVDKPTGGAIVNDNIDGNNGSGNDIDCEDDNNGVGVPGHCRLGESVKHNVEVAGVGSLRVTVMNSGNGTVTIVVTRPNGEVVTASVAAPSVGSSTIVPVTIHGVRVGILVTGTTGGAVVSAGTSGAGTTARIAKAVERPSGTAVLGERASRALSGGTMSPRTAAVPTSGSAAVTAPSASATPASTALPFTGSEDTPLAVMIGATALLTGIGLVRAARRPRAQVANRSA